MEQKQKEALKFSWTGLFIVTAICFISFAGLLRLLNGSASHSSLFLNIGFISLVLGGLSFINDLILKPAIEKEEDNTFHRSSKRS